MIDPALWVNDRVVSKHQQRLRSDQTPSQGALRTAPVRTAIGRYLIRWGERIGGLERRPLGSQPVAPGVLS